LKKYRPKMIIESHLFKEGYAQIESKIRSYLDGLALGYVGETVPYSVISHTFWKAS